MINGSCHCGAVRFTFPSRPEWLTSCNCSICRRFSSLWAYAPANQITINAADDATIAYVHGDKTLAMHSCRFCGGTTHWIGLDGDDSARMAVNFRMCEPADYAAIRIRRFDGADTWKYLD